MGFGEDVLEYVSVGVEGRERNRLVRLSRIQVRRVLLLSVHSYVGVLVPYDMPAVPRLEEVLLVRGAILGGVRDGSHGQVVDARDLGRYEVGRRARQREPCQHRLVGIILLGDLEVDK